MPTLSALLITRNEERNVEACLQSLTWTDQIVVVDSGSIDKTCEIASRYTNQVVFHEWSDHSAQLNYGQTLASGDWILRIDADERVTPALRSEIQAILRGAQPSQFDAYRLPIRDWMFGKFVAHGSWPHQAHVRLYRSGHVTWAGAVHEHAEVRGRIGRLSEPLLHYSHVTVGHFIDKLNRYTSIEADEMFQQGLRAGLPGALLGAMRAFLGQYVRLRGFRDGGHGLILAIYMATYYFTTRAKLWSLWYMHDHRDPK